MAEDISCKKENKYIKGGKMKNNMVRKKINILGLKIEIVDTEDNIKGNKAIAKAFIEFTVVTFIMFVLPFIVG